jgi:hypothetical protein
MKKNCENCQHLSYEEGDEGFYGGGFSCEKRYERLAAKSDRLADELLGNLEHDSYLKKAKVCCDLKDPGAMVVSLECPKCSDIFTGYARDAGGLCSDCYAVKHHE